MNTRTIRHLLIAAVAITSLLLPLSGVSGVSTGDETLVKGAQAAALQPLTQAAVSTHDLAILSIKAPKKVTLSSKKTTVVAMIKVAIQNRGPEIETIPNQSTLSNVVSLTVVPQSAESSCSAPVPLLHTGKPQPVFPIALKPNKTLNVVFDVTFSCAVDPLKGSGHEDFHYIAQVNASALDGQEDVNPASDVCPRSPVPVVDGSPKDKGCGSKLSSKKLGGPVLSDVVIKSDGGDGSLSCSTGGVVIEEPTYESHYSVSIPSIQLSGIAPLAQSWAQCYPCVPTSSGVTVSWANEASGAGRTAYSLVTTTWFFGYPMYTHHWYDIIALQPGVNLVKVMAYESSKLVGQDCVQITYIEDSVAPQIPGNLAVTSVSPSNVGLSWEASLDNVTTDDATVDYVIYRDGAYLSTVSTTFFADTGLKPGTQYCYSISSIDAAGNESAPSSTVCQVTPDEVAPTVPAEVHSIILPTGGIALSWNPATDDVAVTGYKIWRNDIELATVPTPGYEDLTVDPYTRYCYTVYAYDSFGNDSSPSEESCSDTSWNVATIDDSSYNVGRYSAIAADPSGAVHIAYYDDVWHDLKYATNRSGTWVISTIDRSGIVGWFPSIALDHAGDVHIAYYDYGDIGWLADALKYATNASGSWTTATVGPGGWYSSLALDSQDHAHVASRTYYTGGGSYYATNATGGWQSEWVATPEYGTRLALDAQDHVHLIAYQYYYDDHLFYISNKTGSWVSESIDMAVGGNDLAIDAQGAAHISYCDYSGGLHHATNASGSWIADEVDTDSCRYTAMVLDANGHARISYLTASGYLNYASFDGDTWVRETIDKMEIPENSYDAYPVAIAIDAAGQLHISYYGTGMTLKYAATQ